LGFLLLSVLLLIVLGNDYDGECLRLAGCWEDEVVVVEG
jgi:hypothetical protein